MKKFKYDTGTTLVELLVAMAIFGLILVVMLTLYATMIKTSASTRKIAKVEGEITNTVWPLFKEIESAGYGVPANSFGGNCTPEISYTGGAANGVFTIYTTATGTQTSATQTGAGSWSFIIGPTCTVCMAGTGCPGGGLNNGDNVSIINPSDKSSLGTTTVAGGALAGCNAATWPGDIAYFVSPAGGPAGSCFATSYTLYPSAIAPNSSAQPATCASGTNQLWRSSVAAGNAASYQPMLDCVLAVSYIFGCIDTSGNVTWVKWPAVGNTCPFLNSNGNYNPRFVRIGLVVQDSNQNEYSGTQPQPNIVLFSDTTIPYPVSLNATQEIYRWRTIERTISLKNLE